MRASEIFSRIFFWRKRICTKAHSFGTWVCALFAIIKTSRAKIYFRMVLLGRHLIISFKYWIVLYRRNTGPERSHRGEEISCLLLPKRPFEWLPRSYVAAKLFTNLTINNYQECLEFKLSVPETMFKVCLSTWIWKIYGHLRAKHRLSRQWLQRLRVN